MEKRCSCINCKNCVQKSNGNFFCNVIEGTRIINPTEDRKCRYFKTNVCATEKEIADKFDEILESIADLYEKIAYFKEDVVADYHIEEDEEYDEDEYEDEEEEVSTPPSKEIPIDLDSDVGREILKLLLGI